MSISILTQSSSHCDFGSWTVRGHCLETVKLEWTKKDTKNRKVSGTCPPKTVGSLHPWCDPFCAVLSSQQCVKAVYLKWPHSCCLYDLCLTLILLEAKKISFEHPTKRHLLWGFFICVRFFSFLFPAPCEWKHTQGHTMCPQLPSLFKHEGIKLNITLSRS